MIVAMLRGAVVLMLVAGCDMLFQLDHVDRVDDALVPGDVPLDVPGGGCASPIIDDDFTSQTPCDTWGTKYENLGATVFTGGSQLTIQPAAMAQSSGGCASRALVPFGTGGIAVDVADVLSGGKGEYTELHIYDTVPTTSIGVANNTLIAGNSNVLYSATMMHWWRLRPSDNSIEAEYSADGISYQAFAKIPLPGAPPPTVSINLIGGLDNNPAFGNLAVFRRLLVCP
jgi:hypothetical protein